MRVAVVAGAFLATASMVQATAYLQCANVAIQIALFPAVINIVSTLLSPANSYSGCPTFCKTQNKKYSLYQPGLLGVLGTCYCVDNDPGGNYILSGTDSVGNCAIAQFQINYLEDSPFSLTRCQTGGTFTGRLLYSAYMVMNTDSAGVISCTCPMFSSGGTAKTCGVATNNVYKSTTVVASEAARRRRNRIARELAADAELNAFCPRGLTPCRILGSTEDAYECLHTPSELESCGGCINGLVSNGTAAAGEDCTKMAGVVPGAVACVKSRCVAHSCRDGFTRRNGRCIPALVGQ